MHLILVTRFKQQIYIDEVKVVDDALHYKLNSSDTCWQSISRSLVSHIQTKETRSI